jgi:hypothetical protein
MDEADRISLAHCLGQLRHAYLNLLHCKVNDQGKFADGLIAPQIRFLESLANKYPRAE